MLMLPQLVIVCGSEPSAGDAMTVTLPSGSGIKRMRFPASSFSRPAAA
jgi:hypothetical protein